MTCTRTATLPVTPDEAFALITEPERLRRWKTVSATVDLRAGGGYRFTGGPGHGAAGGARAGRRGLPVHGGPRTRRRGQLPRGRARPSRGLRLGLGGQPRPAAGRL